MELSEAKEILKEWLEYNKEHKDEIRKADTIISVQETILKALDNKYFEMVLKEQDDIINYLKSKLDNSISKDKIKELIEEETNGVKEAQKEKKKEVQFAHQYARLTLKSLLKE